MKTIIKRKSLIIVSILSLILLFVFLIFKTQKYNKDERFSKYNLTKSSEDSYIDFLKQFIYPVNLRKYIKNEYINLDLYYENATGNDVRIELYNEAYENLFIYLFNKETINFDNCPVTDGFKQKYKIDLLDYFNLKESEDCNNNCLLNSEEKEVVVEVYGDLKNTEPTYWKTHHFHYTLDSDGNVDDVIFDYTE